MDIDKIGNEVKSLGTKINAIQEHLDNKNITTENVADQMCGDISYTINKTLLNLFGDETNKDDTGLIGFSYTGQYKYKMAVMFSHFDFDRETRERRENFFYKGNRWSDGDNKKKFYFFFDKLKNELCKDKDNVPVTFLTKLFIQKNVNYIRVECKEFSDKDNGSIIEPMEDKRYSLKLPLFPQDSGISKALKPIKEVLENDTYTLDGNQTHCDEIWKEAATNIKDIVNKFENNSQGIISNYVKLLKKEISDKLCADYDEKDIFSMLVLYQLYDIPYTMHFFLPKVEANRERADYCTLAFSTHSDYQEFNQKSIPLFENLIDHIENLSEKKRVIWLNVDPRLKNEWEKFYKENLYKYNMLAKVAENIFQAICKKNNINATVTHRVKTFDSLFNKLVNRANGKDADFLPTDGEGRNKFKRSIQEPTKQIANEVFQQIKDLVGLRIVCTYNQDVQTIHETIFPDKYINGNTNDVNDEQYQKFQTYGLILKQVKDCFVRREKDPQTASSGYFYTSYHFIFELDESRRKLIEFEDILDIQFELQVRTILSQGISEVSHEVYYKTGLPSDLEKEVKIFMRGKLDLDSWNLHDIDKKFDEYKKEHNIYKNKAKRHNR